MKRSVKLPAKVLAHLIRENAKELKDCLEVEGNGQADMSEYFTASKIKINGDSKLDLVVQPGKYCLQGAHNTVYWIFVESGHSKQGGYRLIFTERADLMDVLKTASHGYHDLRTISHTINEIYSTIWKFDGVRYTAKVCTIENLETNKVVSTKCA